MIKFSSFFILVIVFFGCSESQEKDEIIIPEEPTPSDKAISEISLLLPLLDSGSITPFITTFSLQENENDYRSEAGFNGIVLKRIFKSNNGILSNLHFDFYYDSTSTTLTKDIDSVYRLISSFLGETKQVYSDGSIKTFSWNSNNNIFDFETFNNGYTLTLRKEKSRPKPIKTEGKLAPQFSSTYELIKTISAQSLLLNKTKKDEIVTLFNETFLEKTNALAFKKAYGDNILLSASFLFKDDKLTGVYFDYFYNDTSTEEIVVDSKIVKSILTKQYGQPSSVATVELSTSYEWDNTPIILEVYGNGFSVVFEDKVTL